MKVNTEELRVKLEDFESKHGVVAVVKESDCVNCTTCYQVVGMPARSF